MVCAVGNIEKAEQSEKLGGSNFISGIQALNTEFQNLDKGFLTSELVKFKIGNIAIMGENGLYRAAEKNDRRSVTMRSPDLHPGAFRISNQVKHQNHSGLLGDELKDKENVLGLLNYYVGYIKYYRQKETETLPVLFKASQYSLASKAFPADLSIYWSEILRSACRMDKVRVEKMVALKKNRTKKRIRLL